MKGGIAMITILVLFFAALILSIIFGFMYMFWKVFLVLGILTLIDILVFRLIFRKKNKDDKKEE